MKETRKQLNNLIRDFYDESEAVKMAREIEDADTLMASVKTFGPRAEVIEQIKQRMLRQSAAMHRKTLLFRPILAAAAACLLIGAGLILYQVLVPPVQAELEPGVVQAFFSDQPVEKITTNLDEISDQIYVIHASGWDSTWEEEVKAVEEIEEMDLLTDTDFWKG